MPRDGRFVVFAPEPFPDRALAVLDDRFEVRQGRTGQPYGDSEYATLLADVDAIAITSRESITRVVIRSAPALRVIAKSGARPSNVDFDAAAERGIRVIWTPGANTVSVAEMTLTLLLAAAKRLPEVSGHLRAGGWRSYDLLGAEVAGKTLGLIGLGAVGREVASRFRAFGGKVVAYDPFSTEAHAAPLNVELLGLEDLLGRADIVSLHCELNADTQRLLGKAAFARMKDGAILVNTARGGLVDEKALLTALDSGRLGAAALDVFAVEPVSESNPLIGHPRVIGTPHVAAFTDEAILRETMWCLEDAGRVLTGLEPNHMPPASR